MLFSRGEEILGACIRGGVVDIVLDQALKDGSEIFDRPVGNLPFRFPRSLPPRLGAVVVIETPYQESN